MIVSSGDMAKHPVENVLWLCTTADALELPVAVAGSVKELAQMLDVSVETIYLQSGKPQNEAASASTVA